MKKFVMILVVVLVVWFLIYKNGLNPGNNMLGYYKNIKTCTPTVYVDKSLGIARASVISGKTGDLCVISEEITSTSKIICNLPDDVAAKYSDAYIHALKRAAVGKELSADDYVTKINTDSRYCRLVFDKK